MHVITVEGLSKHYVVPEREAGTARAAAKKPRQTKDEGGQGPLRRSPSASNRARSSGFSVRTGRERPPPSKCSRGCSTPTGGTADVLGHVPHRREKAFLSQITLVMGQRNQLIWDIPMIDSLERNRAVYRISRRDYSETLDELTELLELESLLPKPVRNLSLGERMKCEIAAALLHRPRVLFLDEPTIGLDVTMQRRIRSFVDNYNRTHGATVLCSQAITWADVEALWQACRSHPPRPDSLRWRACRPGCPFLPATRPSTSNSRPKTPT